MPNLPALARAFIRSAYILGAGLVLAGCDTAPGSQPVKPQDAFWTALSNHCGRAYAGRLVSEDKADTDMRGADMVMHVRECSDERIAIPFHIRPKENDGAAGEWDRSRTWLITRTDGGLCLKHDHRHEDGTSDTVTMYGGDTASRGSARAQDFPVDAESVALFERERLTASVTNVWRIEIDDNGFAYQLTRPAPEGEERGRRFRAEFDLTRPIETPPAAWGHGASDE